MLLTLIQARPTDPPLTTLHYPHSSRSILPELVTGCLDTSSVSVALYDVTTSLYYTKHVWCYRTANSLSLAFALTKTLLALATEWTSRRIR